MLQDLRNKWEAQVIGILECTTNIQSMYLSSTTYSHQLSPIIKANLAYLHTIHFVLEDDGLESLKMLNQFPALMHLKISFSKVPQVVDAEHSLTLPNILSFTLRRVQYDHPMGWRHWCRKSFRSHNLISFLAGCLFHNKCSVDLNIHTAQ
jgi:hypothetical protein